MDSSEQTAGVEPTRRPLVRESLLFFVALVAVLAVGAYFRFTGLMWGEYEYPHPDERFLVWVVADIAPVEEPSQYFATATSTLNPANRGHKFYVYGDLPVIVTRYLTEAVFDTAGWAEILKTGRAFSAVSDLVTVLLVFLTAARLFGWRTGFLAGLFASAAVLQIQQSHFFTVDAFSTTFTMLAVYLAVLIASGSRRVLLLGALFGAAVGLAMACKLNTVAVAALLPAALLLRWLHLPRSGRKEALVEFTAAAALGGVVAFLIFRVAQPYAFTGPGFFDLRPDETWLKSIRDLQAQSAGDVDFPPALQWARRSHLFSFQNLTLWGLGLPLGLLAWAGFAWMAYRLVRCALALRGGQPLAGLERCLVEVHRPGSLVVWGWTAFYFFWQSMAWNPTMRYQLPIYPTLSILAAWLLHDLWNNPRARVQLGSLRARFRSPRAWRAGVAVLGGIVLLLTLAWAFAFTRIYTRPETRVAATRWIFENVPGPANLHIETAGGDVHQLLPLGERATIRPGQPYLTYFRARQAGVISVVTLPRLDASSVGGVGLAARVFDPAGPSGPLAQGWVNLPPDAQFDSLSLPVDGFTRLEPGKIYGLALELTGLDGQPSGWEEGGTLVNVSGALQLSLYERAQAVSYQQSGSLATVVLPEGGTLRELRLPPGSPVLAATVLVHNPLAGQEQLSMAFLPEGPGLLTGSQGAPLRVDPPLALEPGVTYNVAVTSGVPGQQLDLGGTAQLAFLDRPFTQSMPALAQPVTADEPLWIPFSARAAGQLEEVTLAYAAGFAVDAGPNGGTPTVLLLELFSPSNPAVPLAQARVETDLLPQTDPRGQPVTFSMDPPVALEEGKTYNLRLTPDAGAVAVRGSAPANETNWDMGLPFRMDGYDPYGGIFRGDLNFDMYADDNEDKRQRFLNILDQADYVFMSSNRQWGTTTRLPERHPLTTQFYRDLLGCPDDKEVIWCYNIAGKDTFQGRLGYEVAAVFTSYPNLGPLRFNTQFAEEAFSVYDHPKVFIFRKTDAYDPADVRARLNAVDLSKVVRVSPKKAADFKNMLLPDHVWAIQQAGGTFSELFPPEGLLNRFPVLGLLALYLFLAVLGWVVYPLVRLALGGLPDRGYPLARIAGIVIFGYLAWIGGSLGVPVTRAALAVLFAGLALAGLWLALLQRATLRAEWAARRGYFLRVELVALALFAISLLIRLGNPDLWHPIFGGEKPMNFSYFNAVLKSTVFPPYDPWFAGGSMNYYYYGYVLVGMPVKLLGINPSVAYNLVLPALFSMVGLAAFSIGVNLGSSIPSKKGRDTGRGDLREPRRNFASDAPHPTSPRRGEEQVDESATPVPSPEGRDTGRGETGGQVHESTETAPHPTSPRRGEEQVDESATPVPSPEGRDTGRGETGGPLHESTKTAPHPTSPRRGEGVEPARLHGAAPYGLIAILALLILGNLGTVRMFWQGWQKIVVSEEEIRAGTLVQHWSWAAQGFARWVGGNPRELPYYPGDWYWKPSRAIQPESGGEITEFPFFTFLYADLHAHLMALPVTLLLIAWSLAVVLARDDWGVERGRLRRLAFGLFLLLGALAAGALRPANTWDQYTYLIFASVALFYGRWQVERQARAGLAALVRPALLVLGFAALALLLYSPFDRWFAQGYSKLELWDGATTGLSSYLVHWGLFLFVITAWLFDETVDWMAKTPLSRLGKLRAYRGYAAAAGAVLLAALAFLLLNEVYIALVAVPLGLWVTVLLFRPGQPDAKRAVLFMTGTALALTLAVELVRVSGDIGRMNTVFKFYFQAWSLLALSAAAALVWLWPRLNGWIPGWRGAWQVGLGLLVFGAALFPIFATRAKIMDRMVPDVPLTLDGMRFMTQARYSDGPDGAAYQEMDLNQDYRAIRWMQANIPGSPVIVEAHTPEYRHWGTRFTIYTGLPGVVGWNWHQRQQRALTPDTWVWDRVNAIPVFYETTSLDQAVEFLKRYNVQYIVLGQLERIYYDPRGLAKFEEQEGVLWDTVYEEGQTAIYRVRIP